MIYESSNAGLQKGDQFVDICEYNHVTAILTLFVLCLWLFILLLN